MNVNNPVVVKALFVFSQTPLESEPEALVVPLNVIAPEVLEIPFIVFK